MTTFRRPPQDHTSAFVDAGSRFVLEPIAVTHSPYKERFGTPHQSTTTRGTRENAPGRGEIELLPHIPVEALRGIEGFERIWVIYVFHMNEGWSTMVRSSRGPRIKRGVLATRSPHRPNRIGLSALEVERVEGRTIHVVGLDLLDGTPILDIKPYIPYADAFPGAKAGWVDEVDAWERAREAAGAGEDPAGVDEEEPDEEPR